MKDITALLAKGKLTGAEVGKLLIKNYINDIIEQGKGNADYKPLFSEKEFNKLIENLATERQITIYNVYYYIYRFMINGFNRSGAFQQQFYHGFHRYLGHLERLQKQIENTERLLQLPLIVTKKQYETLAKAGLEMARQEQASLYTVVSNILDYYIKEYEADRYKNIPLPIKQALDTATETEADEEEAEEYKENHKKTVLTLPDGRTSEELKGEAWQMAFLQALAEQRGAEEAEDKNGYFVSIEKATEKHRETARAIAYNGIEWYIENYNLTERERAELEALREIPEQELADAIISLLQDADFILYATSNISPASPKKEACKASFEALKRLLKLSPIASTSYIYSNEKITKYDILCTFNDYILSYGNEALEDLKASTPAIYEAITSIIKASLPGVSLEKDSLIATCGELADLNIPGFEDYKKTSKVKEQFIEDAITGETGEDIIKRGRASRGIAIIDNGTDEYKDFTDTTLYSLIGLAQDDIKAVEIVAIQERLIKPALSYLYAYNAFLEILNAVFDIDISIVKADTNSLEQQIEIFNNILYMNYLDLPGAEGERNTARKLYKLIFKPIFIEECKPSQEAKETLLKRLEQTGTTDEAKRLFKDNIETFINELERSAKSYNKELYGR